jgi:putative thiamine transport system permease protein
MLLPVGAGLFATFLPAFGVLPALGGTESSLDAFHQLFAWPGFSRALALTIGTGAAATTLSLLTALVVAVAARRASILRVAQATIAPLLATPHSALAIGFAFLVAPSGWIARAISPWLTGWTIPPDLATVQDSGGIALVLGLWLKETPYLLLTIFAALAQADAVGSARVAAALGYGPWRAWALVVLPRVWPQLRLPVMAVLAFSLSVVDVALVLGPGNPPTLPVQIVLWFSDPDLSRWFPASAASVFLCVIVAAALLAILGMEWIVARIGQWILTRGRRGGHGRIGDATALLAGGTLGGGGLLALLVLALWSVTSVWRFPSVMPQVFSLSTWRGQLGSIMPLAATTLLIGGAATLIALCLCIACLENERRNEKPPGWALPMLYVPLLVPQTAFLFGFQIVLVRARLDGTLAAVVLAHLVFVLPYVFLALSDPWRALDSRFARTALCLGVPPWRVLLRVKLPLLARPLFGAAAIGFAVSAGLYLPTLFAGAGRVETLTTVAVALASGGDRRILAATALAQAALPLAVFCLAVGVPAARERRRRGLALAA